MCGQTALCNIVNFISHAYVLQAATGGEPVVQDEVRALGRLPQLNVPEAFISRHPFPGMQGTSI